MTRKVMRYYRPLGELERTGLSGGSEGRSCGLSGGLSAADCTHKNGEITVTKTGTTYTAQVYGSQGQRVYLTTGATSDQALQSGRAWAKSKGYPDPAIPPTGCPGAVAPVVVTTVPVVTTTTTPVVVSTPTGLVAVTPTGTNFFDDLIAAIKNFLGMK